MDQEQLKIALSNASDARKTEIGLLWSRSLYFWGFLAVALTSYSAALNANYLSFAVLSASAGFIISICWSLVNRSSKFWQETWERKADSYAEDLLGENFFTDNSRVDIVQGRWFGPMRFSVSKLAMAVSDMFCFIWLILVLVAFVQDIKCGGRFLLDLMTILATAGYVFFIVRSCRTDR